MGSANLLQNTGERLCDDHKKIVELHRHAELVADVGEHAHTLHKLQQQLVIV